MGRKTPLKGTNQEDVCGASRWSARKCGKLIDQIKLLTSGGLLMEAATARVIHRCRMPE
jgi:hypothetical protein